MTEPIDGVEEAAGILSHDPRLQGKINVLVGVGGSAIFRDANRCIRLVLNELQPWERDVAQSEIDAVVSRLFDELTATEGTFDVYAPLVGMTCDVDLVEMAGDCFIVRDADAHNDPLQPERLRFDGRSRTHVLRTTAVAPIHYGDAAATGIGDQVLAVARQRIVDALTALHLATDGSCGIEWIWQRHNALVSAGQFGVGASISPKRFAHTNLTGEQRPLLSRTYDLIRSESVQADKSLSLALSRFADAVQRERLEDKLLDLMISAEALLLPADNQELSFRLAARAAALLATGGTDRRTAFDDFRSYYRIRSDLVHGNAVAPERLSAAATGCETHIRKCLLLALKIVATSGRVHGELLDWDAEIFGHAH